MDQILEEEQEGDIDPSTLIRLACLGDDVFADDEDDLSAWKSSTKNIDVSTKVNADLVASLIARLRTRVVELEGECESLSVSTGDGIANAMSEYRTIISSCSDIQRSVNDMSASMQRLGTDFSERIQALVELDVAHCRMKETKAVIGLAGEILGILREIYTSMNEGDVYHAAKMYRSACLAYKPSLEEAAKGGWQEEDGRGSGDGVWDVREESSFMKENLGYIAPFLLKRLEEIEDRLDQQVSSMVKEWLAYAGQVAEKVGVHAMKQCEEYHMYCAEESNIRKRCFDDLTATEDDDERVQIVMDAVMEARRGWERREGSEAVEVRLDMLLNAVSVQTAYSDMTDLQRQYENGREGQLGTLLVPPEDGLRGGAYLAQLVGYFIVELSVYRYIKELDTSRFLGTVWDGACAAMSAELGSMLDESASLEGMLKMKDQALFACQSLEEWSVDVVNTTPLRQSLRKRASRFQMLLQEPTLADLENSEGEAESLQKAVETCLKQVMRFFDGLVSHDELVHASVFETEHVFFKMFTSLMPEAETCDAYDNAYVDELLSLIESIRFVQRVLVGQLGQAGQAVDSLSQLKSLIQDAVTRLAQFLCKRTMENALDTVERPHDVWNLAIKTEDPVSPWCDAIIEQIEFQHDELREFGFPDEIVDEMMSAYLKGISSRIAEFVQNYKGSITGIGAFTLYRDLQSLTMHMTANGGRDQCSELVEILVVSKSVAFGDSEALIDIKDTDLAGEIAALRVSFLEKVVNSSHKVENLEPISRARALSIIKKLKENFL
jgi:hypothetical protein